MTVLMAVLAVAVFGSIAAQRLPVELLPDLSYPTLTIQTRYQDAAPISVEQFVSRPVEEAVGVIPGVRDLRSVSRAGFSEVVLEFDWAEDMDLAALEVREKLGLVQLPDEAERPRVLRFDPSLDPVIRLGLKRVAQADDDGGREGDLAALHDLAERWLKPRLEAIPGVAAAKVRGGLEGEVEVLANEDRMAALGLTLSDLADALQRENVDLPGGVLQDAGSIYLVRTQHAFATLRQLRDTVVRERPDGRVRLEDVATVRFGHKDREQVTHVAGTEVVELALHREGSANTMQVAAAVRAELETIRADLAAGTELELLSDQSRYISAAVGEVWSAALLGGLLAVLVVYFFLRDIASTVTIALTIPVSVVATFLPLHQAGVSLNIMSLGGLALGIGMLVDNAIVVLEAIDRQRRAEPDRGRAWAAARGASDVAGAVTAATFTTVSVFLPIVFVTGVAGQLFYDLAVTVCFALVASLVTSLTLIPALAALDLDGLGRGLVGGDEAREAAGTTTIGPLRLAPLFASTALWARLLTWIALPVRLVVGIVLALLVGLAWAGAWLFHHLTRPAAAALDGIGRVYPGILRRSLARPVFVVVVTVWVFTAALLTGYSLPTALVPSLAQGEFAFQLRLPEGTPLEATAKVVEQIQAPLQGDPRFARLFSVAGSLPSSASGRRTQGENLAQIDVVLPDGADAADEAAAVARVREVLSQFANVEAERVQPQVLSLKPAVVIQVFAEDLAVLDASATQVAAALEAVPGLSDITTGAEPGSPEITVELDRDRAASLGIDADRVARSIRRQLRGEVLGRFRLDERRLDIRLRSSERFRRRADDVARLRIRLPAPGSDGSRIRGPGDLRRNPGQPAPRPVDAARNATETGQVVPISAVARVRVGRGPAALHHASGARVARVTARVGAGDLGQTLEQVNTVLAGLALPAGAVAEPAGQDQELSDSFAGLRLALALAVFLVFTVMAIQFESLRHPFVILLSVPLGVVGVIVALRITGGVVDVLVLIGTVMLAGIVVNNAIVLVDAVNRRRRAGEALEAALLAGGEERLRPILMTTATTVLALLPLAIGWGAGSELRAPLANTVIGGLTCATVLTLVVIPCIYRLMGGELSDPLALDEAVPATPPDPPAEDADEADEAAA